MRIIRVADQPDAPWKNGGGTTRELLSARGPTGFDWRISVATIDRGGPFSSFPGVDRTLIGLAGQGRLEISGQSTNVVPGAMMRFDGSEPVVATINNGPIHVLNIMSGARGWRQEITFTEHAEFAAWHDDHPRMFAILYSDGNVAFQPGDLIMDIGKDEAFDGVTAIEISFAQRTASI